MARARKRHIQLEIEYRRDKNGHRRGGARPGAGRKAKPGRRRSEKHRKRPEHDRRNPVLITSRLMKDLGGLRRRHLYTAIRWATQKVLGREDFRIVHMSIQHDHLHLIVEANSKRALERGMQGFLISAARHVNRAVFERTGVVRTGKVVEDRYHARALTSPRAVRHALAYVLNN